jgi:hyperosmotically inducible periplasmic protein
MNRRMAMRPGKRLARQGSVLLIACVCVAQAGAAAPDAAPNPLAPSKLFRKLDTDHDGFVSRAEASREKSFLKAFDQADGYRRGRLNPEQFVEAETIYDRMLAAAYIDDSVITAKLKAELVKDPLVSALEVGVETYDGQVLLSGFVDSREQMRRAERIAFSVRGVRMVRNNLQLK